MNDTVIRTIDKPWGKEEIIAFQNNYVVKRLSLRSGKRCSLQYHNTKTETIYVISGVLLLHIVDQGIIFMYPGEFYTILPQVIHRMEGGKDTVYLESSTPELDDIVRVEDDYGRK